MKRRTFLTRSALAGAALLWQRQGWALGAPEFPEVRVPLSQRKFSSPAVEALIAEINRNIGNKEVAWLFGNCFPNTLDTTVEFEVINGKPDTFVITGDIDAMWLRDSSAQVWPYLPLMKEDKNLKELIKGVINRQVKCIRKDPYANAFYKDENKISEWKNDKTEMKPGVHERKWEIDSLCYPIRLAHGYWKETGDTSLFDTDWLEAMRLVVQTFREQQRLDDKGPYRFERETSWATDGLPLGGYGYPTKKIGLIHSMFRPSDDATVYPFLIPSNYFALQSLNQLDAILKTIAPTDTLRLDVAGLSKTVGTALRLYGTVNAPGYGTLIPYEINGNGSSNLMDDANVPSLLSLPYLAPDLFPAGHKLYAATRKFVLSEDNLFFFKGKAAEGVGGPHVGLDYIWPLGIIMRGITSNNEQEMRACLGMLQRNHAGTGFMHESFHKDDPAKFTRKWFAWANTLFGEWVWKLYREKRSLLA